MFNFRKRIERLQTLLKEENLDALVLATVEGNNKNIYYLSGFGGTAGVLAISQNDAVLAVDGRYTLRAKNETSGLRIVDSAVSDRRVVDFTNYVVPAVKALGLPVKNKIGFEGTRVSVHMAEAWKGVVGGDFIATTFLVEKLRQQKDAEEIKYLEEACRITDEVFNQCVQNIKAGMNETEVAVHFDITLREKGALMNSFDTIVASGPNSAIPHHETGDRVLEAGDPVTIDFGGLFKGGYCSDITRTIFVEGKAPDPKLVEIYNTVLNNINLAFKNLKPGIMWKEYDGFARAHIEKAGYGEYFTHGLGHSLGLEAHDPYNYADSPFEEGVVITNEPGIYIPEIGGVRIEDDLVVTKDGARLLTEAPYLAL